MQERARGPLSARQVWWDWDLIKLRNINARAYPLRDFRIICRVCMPFQAALADKILLDLLKGLRSYGGFKLMVSGFCQIFSVP